MTRRGVTSLVALAGLLVAYLVVPVVAFVARFADHAGGVSRAAARPSALGAALGVSLQTASIATGVIAVLGIPLGYLLARGHGRVRDLVGVLVQLPLALPPLISGILLIYVVGPYTFVGQVFGGALTESRVGIVLAQTFVAAPFLIVAARSAFAAVEPALDDVAATLGHSRLSRFVRVWLPVAAPGIGAGLLLSWLRAFGEFGATVILAYHPYSLPVYTFVQFGSTGLTATLLPVAAALAAAFAVLTLAVLAPRARRPGRRAPRLPPPKPPVTGEPGPPLCFDLAAHLGAFDLRLAYQPSGRRLALLGPSGAGKTLTLRLLAGLTSGSATHVTLGTQELSWLPAEARGIGYLPQDPALLPHLPVWRQVTFGVDADPALAAYWLSRLGITDLAGRTPAELSGGQRRRVALARALARGPRLLLLDEPSTGLDAPVRDQLRRELRRLQRDTGLTTVVVTHDPVEAALLADDVVIVSHGRLLQAGDQPGVYRRPNSPAAASLLGIRNQNSGTVAGPGVIDSHGLRLTVAHPNLPDGTPVTWCIRPERLRPDTDGHPTHVLEVTDLGGLHEAVLTVGDGLTLTMRTAVPATLTPGARINVAIPGDAITTWPATADGHTSPPTPPPGLEPEPSLVGRKEGGGR
ncbi:MAG: ATP-binding cassette domain-containing protein [Streptosporangiaceae bacterium]